MIALGIVGFLIVLVIGLYSIGREDGNSSFIDGSSNLTTGDGSNVTTGNNGAAVNALPDLAGQAVETAVQSVDQTGASYVLIGVREGDVPVNTVVDINNLVSLESLQSCGVIDRDRIKPPVVFRVGLEGESYAGIGRGEIKLANIPVFVDAIGPLASTTSDSERAMVTHETKRLLMLMISFGGRDGLDELLGRSADLLRKYAQANEAEIQVVE